MIRQFLTWFLTPYRGSNRLSYTLRRKLEKVSLREIIGLNLASLAFVSAIVVPQTQELIDTAEVYLDTQQTTIEVGPNEATLRWPLARFGISQGFSLTHPGLDLTAPRGTAVYPVANGWVAWTTSVRWGYGKHLLVNHDNGLQSLYAHLSEIKVKQGDTVSKATQLGSVGSTGWSTGNHLHLEIYQNGIPINPLEVLPALKK